MPYAGRETNMTDFPFEYAVDDSTNRAGPSLPTCTRSSFHYSNGSLRSPSPTPFDNLEPNTYFPTSEDDRRWSSPTGLSDSLCFPNTFNIQRPYSSDCYNPSCIESLDDFNPHCWHADLEKITEFEKWEPLLTEVKVETTKLPIGHTSSSISPFDTYHPQSAIGSHHHSGLSLVALSATKPQSRSESSSESVAPLLKRRQGSSGRPVHCLPTDAEVGCKLERTSPEKYSPVRSSLVNCKPDKSSPEDAIPEPKTKASTKTLHSRVEHKYRENLNSRMILLDQTLASTRQGTIETDASKETTSVKTRKADVLNKALRYVNQAELGSEARIKEIDFLRLRVAALEKLVGCRDCTLLKQYADSRISQPTDD